MIDPLAVIPSDPPRHCANLMSLFVGFDAEARLRAACMDIIDGDFVPVIAWRDTHLDPALYRWPVRDRHVAIYNELPGHKLCSLLRALVRDGALVAAGVDTLGELHIISDRALEAAA